MEKTLVATAAGSTSLPPAFPNPILKTKFSGDYRIDALIEDIDFRWNKDKPVGSAVEVTFSFMEAKPIYGGTDDGSGSGFYRFSEQQKQAARDILKEISAQTGLTFREVNDSSQTYGQLRFGSNDQTKSSGYAWLPYSNTGSYADRNGDVWISRDYASNQTPGHFNYATLVHETLHALGLKHPGDYDAGGENETISGNYLGVKEDSLQYTTMSYRDAANGLELQQKGMGLYDLLALQYLYGSKAYQAGDDVYRFTDQDGQAMQLLNDTAGYDILNFSAISTGLTIDINEGGFASFGKTNDGRNSADNLAMAFGTQIEEVVATDSNDIITGNSLANVVYLRRGTDRFNGEKGLDTAVLEGRMQDYQLQLTNSSSIIVNPISAQSDGSKTLNQVERVGFSDGYLAFDVGMNQNGGKAYALWYAGFDRAPAPKEIGRWLAEFDAGKTMSQVADSMLKAYAPTVSHQDLVSVLYHNVVGFWPDQAVLNLYTGMLQRGEQTQASLFALAATTAENQNQVIAVVGSQFAYQLDGQA